jgi:hypothetical protein
LFVSSDFTLPVAPGGELDPALYPDDVMAATLATGVRKLPEENELEVVSTLWGNHLPPLPPPYDDSDPAAAIQVSTRPIIPTIAASPVPATTVLDHAIAALAPNAMAGGAEPGASYREGHDIAVSSSDPRAEEAGLSSGRWAIANDQSKDHRTPVSPALDGSVASELSLRGAQFIAPLYPASGTRSVDRSSSSSNPRPPRSASFGFHRQVKPNAAGKDQATRGRTLIPTNDHDSDGESKGS